jgi:hypothetical protein
MIIGDDLLIDDWIEIMVEGLIDDEDRGGNDDGS